MTFATMRTSIVFLLVPSLVQPLDRDRKSEIYICIDEVCIPVHAREICAIIITLSASYNVIKIIKTLKLQILKIFSASHETKNWSVEPLKQVLGLFARCNYLVYFKPKSQRSDTSMFCERYRVIVNACGGPILVAFLGNPCPPIFIPMNLHTTYIVYTSIYSIFIKIVPITQPTKLRPHKPRTVWLSTNNNNKK